MSLPKNLVVKKYADEALTPKTRSYIYGVIGSAVHYNPKISVQVLLKLGILEPVFKAWMADTSIFVTILDKKLFILGLSSLLKLPFNELPPILQQNIKPIIMEST